MNSELVFYEGVNGSGTVASLTYNQSRVIFDFGSPFNPFTQPYDGPVERRDRSRLTDAIRLGQIPGIDGVFPEKDLRDHTEIIPFEKSSFITGVIISHLHLDHMSGIGLIHPDVPVYIHRDGYNLQMALNEIGESVGSRDYSPIDLYKPFMIGEIKVTAYFSDHPCAGAVGFLIELPDGKVYYSGDLRMHGAHLDRVLDDMQKIADEHVDVLILETTTFSPSMFERSADEKLEPTLRIPAGMSTEQQLLDKVQAELVKTDHLGIFNIYHRDTNLMHSLTELAGKANREIVFEPKTAYVYLKMFGECPAIYLPDNSEYVGESSPFFKQVMARTPKIVSREEIQDQPGRYFIQNSYENILELFDLPAYGAKYFHLYGVPLVQGARDYQNMMRVIDLIGVDYASFANLYCFNHAYPNHLLYMAEKLKARYLIGVHSEKPEKLVCKHSTQILPQKGEVFVLKSGKLEPKQ